MGEMRVNAKIYISCKKKYQQYGYMLFKTGIMYAISHDNLIHILILNAASWLLRAFGSKRHIALYSVLAGCKVFISFLF